MKALAITDHGSCSAALEFFKAAKESGIIPIIGTEFYFTDDPTYRPKKKNERPPRFHLTVLAKNWVGLQSIFKMLSLANSQFYYKPVLSLDQCHDFENCVVMSACAVGILAHPQYKRIVQTMHKAYGDDFYLEIMPHPIEIQRIVNERAVEMCNTFGISPVATNDCHYPNEEDTLAHDILLAIQTNRRPTDEKFFSFIEGDEPLAGLYLKNATEMMHSFKPLIQDGTFDLAFVAKAFKATNKIAAKCSCLEIPTLDFTLPAIPMLRKDSLTAGDESKFLIERIMEGWKRLDLTAEEIPVYKARLQHELKVISKIGAIRYFLIVWDIIRQAKDMDILCGFGRGSAGGSLVAYLLGIVGLNPLKHELYFERFLREDRIDMPDIDLDFAGKDRDRIIQYIHDVYGEDNVSHISTLSIMHGKTAFRDVARIFAIPFLKVNELSKRIDNDIPLMENFENDAVLNDFMQKNPKVVRFASRLDGQLRSKGLHAGGVIITEGGFHDRGVLEYRQKATTINWHMDEVERFGLLKVDILGLNNLSVLNDTARLVKARAGEEIDYFSVVPDDPEVLKQFSDGNTMGFFQFESVGATTLCKRLAPLTSFETLIHINALNRPGPLDSGMVESYVRRYRKEEAITYYHPKEKPITEGTLALPIFQEQIMAYFVSLAGFTWPEADTMRKIISKSKGVEKLEEKRLVFIEGCAKDSDIPEDKANTIYDQIVKFGKYGFNKCISGDSVLKRPGANNHKSYTIREMYKIKNDIEYAKSTGHASLRLKWMRQGGYGYGMSMFSDGRIRKNRIMDIQPAGEREVFRITLTDGSYIDVTENHKFPTPKGKTKAMELSVGDILYKCGAYEKTNFKKTCRFSDKEQNLKGKKYINTDRYECMDRHGGFPIGPDNPGYTNGSYAKFRRFKAKTPYVCAKCGATEGRIETHHKDGNRTNSDWDNLEKLCVPCHKKADYKLGRVRRGQKGYPVEELQIKGIAIIGVIDTWDVTMEAPAHNYVTDQYIITCNSHAADYSLISYLTAWAKYHYPAEFMCSLLRVATGDAEKTGAYIKEIHRLGMKVVVPDINDSESTFSVVGDSIMVGFSSVKGVGPATAVKIQEARREKGRFESFQDFMDKTERRTVNKKAVSALAMAGAFESICPNAKWIIDWYPTFVKGGKALADVPEPKSYRDFDPREKDSMKIENIPGVFTGDDIDVKAEMIIDKPVLEMLQGQIRECDKCELHSASGAVPFHFTRDSRILLVSQKVDSREEMADKPLVGKTGAWLEDIFKERLGLSPGKFLKANIFQCRPPRDKLTKEHLEKTECAKIWLDKLIRATEPKIIFAMGGAAHTFFTGKTYGINSANGTKLWLPDYQALVIFAIHPAQIYFDSSGEKEEMFITAVDMLKDYLDDY